MLCPQCYREIFVDHVVSTDNATRYFYCCVNPQCGSYRKTFSPSGDEGETLIKEKSKTSVTAL